MEFKVKDKVVKRDGTTFSNGEYIAIVTDAPVGDRLWVNHGGWVHTKDISTVTVPHKHKDAIIAWANGAKIQARVVTEKGVWLNASKPAFMDHHEYRVAPEIDQVAIDEVEAKIDALVEQLKLLRENKV